MMNLTPTPEQLAEQHGHEEAEALLNMMKSSKHQATRLIMLHALLLELASSEHREHALGGFAVAILAPLEVFLGLHSGAAAPVASADIASLTKERDAQMHERRVKELLGKDRPEK